MSPEHKAKISKIKLLAMDVDGVLTDSRIIIGPDGTESKCFNVLDGHGIRMWRDVGLQVAFITGRNVPATRYRAKELGVDFLYMGGGEKVSTFNKLLAESGRTAEEIAYIGDDVMDLPLIKRAGFGIAVANAVDEAKAHADHITTKSGGCGAVRELIEYLLKGSGKWEQAMQPYLI